MQAGGRRADICANLPKGDQAACKSAWAKAERECLASGADGKGVETFTKKCGGDEFKHHAAPLDACVIRKIPSLQAFFTTCQPAAGHAPPRARIATPRRQLTLLAPKEASKKVKELGDAILIVIPPGLEVATDLARFEDRVRAENPGIATVFVKASRREIDSAADMLKDLKMDGAQAKVILSGKAPVAVRIAKKKFWYGTKPVYRGRAIAGTTFLEPRRAKDTLNAKGEDLVVVADSGKRSDLLTYIRRFRAQHPSAGEILLADKADPRIAEEALAAIGLPADKKTAALAAKKPAFFRFERAAFKEEKDLARPPELIVIDDDNFGDYFGEETALTPDEDVVILGDHDSANAAKIDDSMARWFGVRRQIWIPPDVAKRHAAELARLGVRPKPKKTGFFAYCVVEGKKGVKAVPYSAGAFVNISRPEIAAAILDPKPPLSGATLYVIGPNDEADEGFEDMRAVKRRLSKMITERKFSIDGQRVARIAYIDRDAVDDILDTATMPGPSPAARELAGRLRTAISENDQPLEAYLVSGASPEPQPVPPSIWAPGSALEDSPEYLAAQRERAVAEVNAATSGQRITRKRLEEIQFQGTVEAAVADLGARIDAIDATKPQAQEAIMAAFSAAGNLTVQVKAAFTDAAEGKGGGQKLASIRRRALSKARAWFAANLPRFETIPKQFDGPAKALRLSDLRKAQIFYDAYLLEMGQGERTTEASVEGDIISARLKACIYLASGRPEDGDAAFAALKAAREHNGRNQSAPGVAARGTQIDSRMASLTRLAAERYAADVAAEAGGDLKQQAQALFGRNDPLLARPEFLKDTGKIYAESNRPELAAAAYERGMRLVPKDPIFTGLLAAFLHRIPAEGDKRRSVELLRVYIGELEAAGITDGRLASAREKLAVWEAAKPENATPSRPAKQTNADDSGLGPTLDNIKKQRREILAAAEALDPLAADAADKFKALAERVDQLEREVADLPTGTSLDSIAATDIKRRIQRAQRDFDAENRLHAEVVDKILKKIGARLDKERRDAGSGELAAGARANAAARLRSLMALADACMESLPGESNAGSPAQIANGEALRHAAHARGALFALTGDEADKKAALEAYDKAIRGIPWNIQNGRLVKWTKELSDAKDRIRCAGIAKDLRDLAAQPDESTPTAGSYAPRVKLLQADLDKLTELERDSPDSAVIAEFRRRLNEQLSKIAAKLKAALSAYLPADGAALRAPRSPADYDAAFALAEVYAAAVKYDAVVRTPDIDAAILAASLREAKYSLTRIPADGMAALNAWQKAAELNAQHENNREKDRLSDVLAGHEQKFVDSVADHYAAKARGDGGAKIYEATDELLDIPEVIEAAAAAHVKKQEHALAVASRERASKLRPADPNCTLQLAAALGARGDRASLERAVGLIDAYVQMPSAADVESARTLQGQWRQQIAELSRAAQAQAAKGSDTVATTPAAGPAPPPTPPTAAPAAPSPAAQAAAAPLAPQAAKAPPVELPPPPAAPAVEAPPAQPPPPPAAPTVEAQQSDEMSLGDRIRAVSAALTSVRERAATFDAKAEGAIEEFDAILGEIDEVKELTAGLPAIDKLDEVEDVDQRIVIKAAHANFEPTPKLLFTALRAIALRIDLALARTRGQKDDETFDEAKKAEIGALVEVTDAYASAASGLPADDARSGEMKAQAALFVARAKKIQFSWSRDAADKSAAIAAYEAARSANMKPDDKTPYDSNRETAIAKAIDELECYEARAEIEMAAAMAKNRERDAKSFEGAINLVRGAKNRLDALPQRPDRTGLPATLEANAQRLIDSEIEGFKKLVLAQVNTADHSGAPEAYDTAVATLKIFRQFITGDASGTDAKIKELEETAAQRRKDIERRALPTAEEDDKPLKR